DFHVTGVQTCALPIFAHLAGTAAVVRGRYTEAGEHLARAVRLGAEVTDPAAQAWAALAAFTLGDETAARTLASAAVAAARRAGQDRKSVGQGKRVGRG